MQWLRKAVGGEVEAINYKLLTNIFHKNKYYYLLICNDIKLV